MQGPEERPARQSPRQGGQLRRPGWRISPVLLALALAAMLAAVVGVGTMMAANRAPVEVSGGTVPTSVPETTAAPTSVPATSRASVPTTPPTSVPSTTTTPRSPESPVPTNDRNCLATIIPSTSTCLRERSEKLPWNGKMLVVADSGQSESYQATYVDSNENGRFDPADAGSFAPGSTIKVAIALAAIEANHGRAGIESDLMAALILSDNAAANRLMDVAGGPSTVTRTFEAKGLSPFIVGRYFGYDRGEDGRCQEIDRPGNCASAAALIRSLRAVREPGTFDISLDDRQWISTQLSSTPRAAGFTQPDDDCRFIHRSGLQKCGISPFAPQDYSDLAYFPDLGLYVFIVVTPPSQVDVAETIGMITDLTSQALAAFGH